MREQNLWQLEPCGSLAEVVGTFMGNQVPGSIKGLHDSWFQGPFLRGCQVLFQLLQAGHAQDDRVPMGTLEGETARRQHTSAPVTPVMPTPPASPLPRPGTWVFTYALYAVFRRV